MGEVALAIRKKVVMAVAVEARSLFPHPETLLLMELYMPTEATAVGVMFIIGFTGITTTIFMVAPVPVGPSGSLEIECLARVV